MSLKSFAVNTFVGVFLVALVSALLAGVTLWLAIVGSLAATAALVAFGLLLVGSGDLIDWVSERRQRPGA